MMDIDNDFDGFDSQGDLLFSIAAGYMQKNVTSEAFLQWFRDSALVIAPQLFASVPDDEKDKAAFWMGFNIWNTAPQPANNYKPVPMPRPQRNQPCPCGSGLKFKRCCSGMENMPQFITDNFWPYIAGVVSKKELTTMAKNHVIPPHALGMIASNAMLEGDYKMAVQLLDPCFEGNASIINYKHSGLMDMLIDAYTMHYSTDRKKRDLLDRLTHHKDRVIRGEAWQRIASWQHDLGNIETSRHALQQAMRADPDNPTHALLELTLLVSGNEIEQARNRARFWLGRLQAYESDYPELISTLREATRDPVTAMHKQYGKAFDEYVSRLERLHSCIEQTDGREIPVYHAETAQTEDEYFGKNTIGMLTPPEAVQSLEDNWMAIDPTNEPFLTQDYSSMRDSTWNDSDDLEWIEFLEKHPIAMDSLNILDSILNLLVNVPVMSDLPHENPWETRVAERGVRIIKKNVKDFLLPWLNMDNRPALRLLASRIYQLKEQGTFEQYISLTEYYLQINPYDNHGLRGELINHYLISGNNEKAMSLAQKYKNDVLPDIYYGRALACYRTGKIEEAQQQLEKACRRFPLIAEYLLKNRVRQPELNPYAVQHGGADQAWLYREEMRYTWNATPGAMKWLKRTASRDVADTVDDS